MRTRIAPTSHRRRKGAANDLIIRWSWEGTTMEAHLQGFAIQFIFAHLSLRQISPLYPVESPRRSTKARCTPTTLIFASICYNLWTSNLAINLGDYDLTIAKKPLLLTWFRMSRARWGKKLKYALQIARARGGKAGWRTVDQCWSWLETSNRLW